MNCVGDLRRVSGDCALLRSLHTYVCVGTRGLAVNWAGPETAAPCVGNLQTHVCVDTRGLAINWGGPETAAPLHETLILALQIRTPQLRSCLGKNGLSLDLRNEPIYTLYSAWEPRKTPPRSACLGNFADSGLSSVSCSIPRSST